MEEEIWYVDTMTSLTSILLNCTHSLLYDITLFCHPPFSKTLHLLHQTKHYSTLISSVYVFIKVAASKAAFIKHTVNIFFLSVCLFSFNRYVQPWSLNRWGKNTFLIHGYEPHDGTFSILLKDGNFKNCFFWRTQKSWDWKHGFCMAAWWIWVTIMVHTCH